MKSCVYDSTNDDILYNIFSMEYTECNENELYTPFLLTQFSIHLYITNIDVHKMISLTNMTKFIKNIFTSFLNIDENSDITKIYWEEFKLIKHFFHIKYLKCVQKINRYFENTLTFVKNRINLEPSFDKKLSKTDFCLAFEKFCTNPTSEINNKLICKICFEVLVTKTIIHEHHCCATICNDCLERIDNSCPFCKCEIIELKKLIL